MHPRDVLAGAVGAAHLPNDLVQGERRRVQDPRVRRRVRQDLLGHQGPGVEHDRAGGDQVAAAQRDQVRRARPGADEMHGHAEASRSSARLAA